MSERIKVENNTPITTQTIIHIENMSGNIDVPNTKKAQPPNDNGEAVIKEPSTSRAAFLSHAYDIAPVKLLHRENELQLLNEICHNESGYFLFKAPAYTGKSSLLSWYFLHPPAETWVVGFFIVGRIHSQSDSNAFMASLCEQLTHLVQDDYSEEQKRLFLGKTLIESLDEVAMLAKTKNKRLVLIVDALDEDMSTNHHLQSIVELLPRHEIPNLVIVLSCRPEPNVQDSPYLSTDHPINNCPVYNLKQLQLSKNFKKRASEELNALYTKSQQSVDIASLLAIANGTLTVCKRTL